MSRQASDTMIVNNVARSLHACSYCGTMVECRKSRKTNVYCCDACALKFIADGLDSTELNEKGVDYYRAVDLGWKAKRKECPVCHEFFFVTTRHHQHRITKTYHGEGEAACKTVICTPMNEFRDKLLYSFHGLMTVEEFNETRKIVMKNACKEHVTPRCMAAAIFYMTALRLQRAQSQQDVARAVKTTRHTMMEYVKKYEHVFGVSHKK